MANWASNVNFGVVLLTLCIGAHYALQIPQVQSTQTPQRAVQEKQIAEPSSSKCRVKEWTLYCGDPDIPAAECEAINCCFEKGQCYYGNAVTVQCTRDGQFVVVVAKAATIPQLNLDTVILLDGEEDACAPVNSTEAYVIFQFSVRACGTSVKEEGGYVIYENSMSSSYEVTLGSRGSVTRDSNYELLFQCRYSETAVEALVVEVNAIPPPLSVVASGPLRVELRLASGQCTTKGCEEDEEAYTSYYTEEDYPVAKILRQPVHVEIRVLGRTDPNLVLQIGNCWATSSPSPLSLPQWDLLVNGCPSDEDRYLTTLLPVTGLSSHQYPTHYKRFVVQMFTFVDKDSLLPLQEQVFIHCNTAVCYHSAMDSCEQRCNRQRRDVSGVPKEVAKGSILVSSGEVVVTDSKALFKRMPF
ncbi:zona pellucida sperm-binding protein 4-like [Clupea harengus]|uniref:Zona pellucida sperm-binding protein 4 n=1 Tax=Clupea harengus TaxID=7950 RepID=A0A6P8G2U1_CLUHA|nr:zona pellucida sperm-binding protein 4-like [Clupea harengus]